MAYKSDVKINHFNDKKSIRLRKMTPMLYLNSDPFTYGKWGMIVSVCYVSFLSTK